MKSISLLGLLQGVSVPKSMRSSSCSARILWSVSFSLSRIEESEVSIYIPVPTRVMEEFLQPMREKRAQYEQNIPQVYEILRKGSEVARAEAAKTLADVRKAMKIDYFDDAELIAEHTKKYQK